MGKLFGQITTFVGLLSDLFLTTPGLFWINFVVFSLVDLSYYDGKLYVRYSLVIPVWDDHPMCVLSANYQQGCVHWILKILPRFVRTGRQLLGANFRKSLRDARQKSVKRGRTQHWLSNIPALLVWMDSASTSSELLSETGSIADTDLRDEALIWLL